VTKEAAMVVSWATVAVVAVVCGSLVGLVAFHASVETIAALGALGTILGGVLQRMVAAKDAGNGGAS
jgi:hypothetical protein